MMKSMENLSANTYSGEANENLKEKWATRTVLFDNEGKVAIINVTKHGYYKIPGGGIEDGEDWDFAARREVAEEAGCDCRILDQLGEIQTDIPVFGLRDISEGFIAEVVGEKSAPRYEVWEQERGFQVEWFRDLDEAIRAIEQNEVKESGMERMQSRDLEFLKLAREKLPTEVTEDSKDL